MYKVGKVGLNPRFPNACRRHFRCCVSCPPGWNLTPAIAVVDGSCLPRTSHFKYPASPDCLCLEVPSRAPGVSRQENPRCAGHLKPLRESLNKGEMAASGQMPTGQIILKGVTWLRVVSVTYPILAFSPPSHSPYTINPASWDHLPMEPPVLKSLSQNILGTEDWAEGEGGMSYGHCFVFLCVCTAFLFISP